MTDRIFFDTNVVLHAAVGSGWMSPKIRVLYMSLQQKEFATSARVLRELFDGAILAAADALQCKTVYSGDLNDGQTYGPVRVVNPFRALI